MENAVYRIKEGKTLNDKVQDKLLTLVLCKELINKNNELVETYKNNNAFKKKLRSKFIN